MVFHILINVPLSETWKQYLYSNSETLSVLKSECYFKAGKGRTIYFLTDKWLQSGILRDNFPGLYALSAAPAYCLADMGEYV